MARDDATKYDPPVTALPAAVAVALERYKALLVSRYGDRLRELVLFGSHARGDAHEESDVDLLVVIDDLTPNERRDAIDLAYDAQDPRDWVSLSPLVLSTAEAQEQRDRERLIMADIEREGIRL
jgi:predicted nucleotidyltransferase